MLGLSRLPAFLCAGLMLGAMGSTALAQKAPAPATVVPESFKCTRSAISAVPRLIADLKSNDEQVRAKAIATLGSLGKIAKPAAPALVELAVNTRGHAATLQALARIDDDATRTALRRLLAGGFGRCKCGFRFTDVVAAAGEPIVPHLMILLPEENIAAAVERVLVQIGAPAVPHLIAGLESKDAKVCLAAVRSLGDIGPKAQAAAPALAKHLASANGALQLHVARSLYSVSGGHQGALDVLHNSARCGDKDLRREALRCLQQVHCKAKELIPTMVKLILDDEDSAYPAGEVLAVVGRDSTPPLIDALIGADAKQAARVVYVLRRLGPIADTAIPVVIRLLDHNDRNLANLAASSLPDFGPQARQGIPNLLNGLKVADFNFRLICAESLARIGREQVPPTIAPIVQILQEGTPEQQHRALWHLRNAGVHARSAVPVLVQLLKTEKLSFRVQIADFLYAVDPSQIEAIMPTLTDAITVKMDAGNGSRVAARLLTRLGPKAQSAVPALKEALKRALKDEDNSIDSRTVVNCLKKIAPAADVMPILIQALNSASKNERQEARYLVQDIFGRGAVASLDAALASGQLRSNPDVVALLKQLRPQTNQ